MTGEHHWRPYLSGGYKCIYCRQEWVPVEPYVDPDEIEAYRLQEPEPESWWPEILGIVVAIILIAAVFAPVGMGK
jgi:hypothetical protein